MAPSGKRKRSVMRQVAFKRLARISSDSNCVCFSNSKALSSSKRLSSRQTLIKSSKTKSYPLSTRPSSTCRKFCTARKSSLTFKTFAKRSTGSVKSGNTRVTCKKTSIVPSISKTIRVCTMT